MKIKACFLLVLVLFFYPAVNIFADDMPPLPSVSVFIRAGENIIFQDTVSLSLFGNMTLTDNENATHEVNINSVLGVLSVIDQNSDSFEISNLQYYSSFSSFYLKCITPNFSDPLCDNWQYVVNDITPATGMDTTILQGGENLGIYFGSNHNLEIDKKSITTEETVAVTAQRYNYLDNSWTALSGVTIGVTQPNPDDAYSPKVMDSKIVGEEGKVIFSSLIKGSYNIGIAEDFYFPSYSLEVTEPEVKVEEKTESRGGGGGGSIVFSVTHKKIDINKAVSFLLSKQKSDGSFGGAMYTDWVAIGLAKIPEVNTELLKNYLLANDLEDNVNLTDYERRAMALLALGIDPARGTSRDYIKDILKSFDGEQFGDKNLHNDDIFALIPLLHSGYTKEDVEIKKAVEFILSKQNPDGSWDSIDMTSAAVQALSLVKELPGVSQAIDRAHIFLFSKMEQDGGFGSSFATAWTMGAIRSIGENPDGWQKNNKNPNDYLFNFQALDGGLESVDKDSGMRVWATSYVLPAAYGLNWHDIMSSFDKKEKSLTNEDVKSQEIGKVLGAEKFIFSLFLKKGSHRIPAKVNEVIELQKFLNINGHGELVIDGKFGSLTEASLIKFQKDKGLPVDGIVGILTRTELNL